MILRVLTWTSLILFQGGQILVCRWMERIFSLCEQTVGQNFSTATLLTFWTGWFFCGEVFAVYYGLFRSIPSFDILDVSGIFPAPNTDVHSKNISRHCRLSLGGTQFILSGELLVLDRQLLFYPFIQSPREGPSILSSQASCRPKSHSWAAAQILP